MQGRREWIELVVVLVAVALAGAVLYRWSSGALRVPAPAPTAGSSTSPTSGTETEALLFASKGKLYVSARAFLALKPLVPELSDPRLGGLAHAGQDLWEQGGARVPAQTNVFLRKDEGRELYAVVLASGADGDTRRWVLAVERTGLGWKRLALELLNASPPFDEEAAAALVARVTSTP